MVLTGKQTKVNPPAAPSRSSSNTVTPKATKRASLNVKNATSVPSPGQQAMAVPDATPPEARRASATGQLMTSTRHDATGPFADDPKFIPSPKKRTTALGKPVRLKPTVKRHSRVYRVKRKQPKPWAQLIKLLTRIAFLLFSIYSLLVCPKDVGLQSPVCRGLEYYRRTIVDPYILPPLRAAVAHPAVAPKIELARPYVEYATEVVTTRYHIVHDKVTIATQPYIMLAQKEYNVRLRPHVKLMQYNMGRYRRQAQPYINLARVKALQTWAHVEPYVAPVLLKVQEAPFIALNFIGKPIEHAKAKYVDPQVRKIVHKVEEMSANAATVGEERTLRANHAETLASRSSLTPKEGETSATTEKATYYSSPPMSLPLPTTPEQTTVSSVEQAATPAVPEPVEEQSATVPDSGAQPIPGTGTTTSSAGSSTESPDKYAYLDKQIHNPNYDEDIEDIEFFEELEAYVNAINVTDPSSREAESASPKPKPTRLTKEELEEKKRKRYEEAVEQRKVLDVRHEEWAKKLEDFITAKNTELANSLKKSRRKVLKDLKTQAGIKSSLAAMKNELAKSQKKAKKILDKLRMDWEDRYGEIDEDYMDKLPLWAQFLEELERNFLRHKTKFEKELGEWTAQWVEGESNMVRQISEEVERFAGQAQTDLIDAYAELWDVTYRDWDRYHTLAFRARGSADELRALLSEKVMPNAITDEILRLESQVAEISTSYEAGVEEIRKEGWKYIFGGKMKEDGEEDINENANAASSTPKQEGQGEQCDKPGPRNPEFSILPIDNLPQLAENVIQGTEAFIGKGKEQVEQAVSMAEAAASEASQKATQENKATGSAHEEL